MILTTLYRNRMEWHIQTLSQPQLHRNFPRKQRENYSMWRTLQFDHANMPRSKSIGNSSRAVKCLKHESKNQQRVGDYGSVG